MSVFSPEQEARLREMIREEIAVDGVLHSSTDVEQALRLIRSVVSARPHYAEAHERLLNALASLAATSPEQRGQ